MIFPTRLVTTNSVSLLKSTSCSNDHMITSSKSLRCATYSEEKCSKYILFFFGTDCKKFLYSYSCQPALSPPFPAPLQKMHRCKNARASVVDAEGKEKRHMQKHVPLVCVGIYLSFRAASSQVLSAPVSLTAVFGMGTGVPSP